MKLIRLKREGGILNFKKAQASGILTFVLLVVFVFGFIMINSWGDTIVDEFTGEFTEANGYSNESIAAITTADTGYSPVIDSIGMLVIIALWILVFVLAYNSSSHPALAFLSIIIVVILAFVGMMLANTWTDMTDDSDFSSKATSYPMLNFVMTNFLVWVLAFGFTMILGFFLGARNG